MINQVCCVFRFDLLSKTKYSYFQEVTSVPVEGTRKVEDEMKSLRGSDVPEMLKTKVQEAEDAHNRRKSSQQSEMEEDSGSQTAGYLIDLFFTEKFNSNDML